MQFSYVARDKSGSFTKGLVEASDQATASEALAEQGLIPVKIGKAGAGLSRDISLRPGVPLLDKVVFVRQLSTMISAGLPLAQSLHTLESQTKNPKLEKAIAELAKNVEGGSSFGSALEKHPKIFNRVMVSMVKAGEVGGILDQVLDRLATQLEREHTLVRKIRGAMIYPTVIVIALIIMFILMMTMVVPQLTQIFEDLGTELPIATRIVIFMSDLFTTYALYTALASAGLAVGLFRFIRTPSGRRLWHRLILKLPVVSGISTKLNVARFTRTLGALLSGGIPVVESIKIVSETSSNVLFREELLRVADQVETGVPISKALEPSPFYPPVVKQMVGVGEETGELDKILVRLAEFYEEEVDNVTKNLTSIIEPILLIVIGLGVGFLVMAILLPIYSIQPQ